MSVDQGNMPPAGEPSLHDVAIVGLGPTGATLATLLAQQGLTVIVFDREADIYRLPRAIHMDAETMRIFQTAGLADELSEHVIVAPGVRFVDGQGESLHVRTRPTAPGAQGWHAAYRFHQPTLESLLRQKLSLLPSASIKLRCEVFSVEQKSGHVALRFEDTSNGRIGKARARFVVGCDGARSTVRRFMGTELDDLKSHERWLVVDVILKRPRQDLGDYGIQFCDPSRPTTYIRGVGNRRRWEFMLMPGDDPAKIIQPESIWGLLSRWITPEDADLERPALYTFHSVVAKGWRNDRLLIAGDAAHQTPPFLGQGMCAGIRDASNLAWKLAAVIRSNATASILDSYESERSAHVRELIEAAVRLGTVIQTTDHEVARRRNQDMVRDSGVFTPFEPTLGLGAHDGLPGAGMVSTQPRLLDGNLLDDSVGYRHALLVTDALKDMAEEAARGHDLVVIADNGAVQAWLELFEAKAILIRPDRYIAGLAKLEAQIAPLVKRTFQRYEPTLATDTRPSIRFTHFGMFVLNLSKMERFYTRVLGFTVTDRGRLPTPQGSVDLVFMSRDPEEHHQIVLVSGRPTDVNFNVINQVSFKAADFMTLREMYRRMLEEGARDIAPRTHGNAVSLYARDPEGNRLEFYVDLPWYVVQPVGVPVDLALDDTALMEMLEQHARSLPGFKSRAQWQTEMAHRMGLSPISSS